MKTVLPAGPSKPAKNPNFPGLPERLEGEPARAHQMLTHYLELGLTRRLKPISEHFKVSLAHVQDLSSEWKWSARVEIYEVELAQHRHLERLEAVKDAAQKHAGTAHMLLEQGLAALEKVDPATLKPLEVVKFISEGIRLERLALGLPGEVQGLVGADGGPVETKVTQESPLDYSKYSTEELITLTELLEKGKKAPPNTAPEEKFDPSLLTLEECEQLEILLSKATPDAPQTASSALN